MNLSPFCRKHESVLCVLKFYIKLFIAKNSSYFPFVLVLCIIGRLITYIGISLLLYTLAPMEQNHIQQMWRDIENAYPLQ